MSAGAMAQSNVRKSNVNRAKQVSANVKKQAAPKPEEDNDVYTVVDQQPEFPGGIAALSKYCERSPMNGKIGKATVSFIVEKDGSVSNLEVMRSLEPSLGEEALRLISSMPKWKPGKKDGKIVRVKCVESIIFRNQNVKP